MRWITIVLMLCIFVLGAHALARGEDGASDEAAKLQKKVKVLELQVAYLLERERALTTYVLGNNQRGEALGRSLGAARAEGFTMAAFSAPSREALLSGLEGLARDVRKDLPVITKEQAALLDRATRLSK